MNVLRTITSCYFVITIFFFFQFPHVSAEESKSITDAIANFIITDLHPPQIVDGRGFLRLLVTLKSPCEIPSTSKITADIIPKMYKSAKEVIITKLV